jgi:uncharacterized protein YndB with AHSA1/START domain
MTITVETTVNAGIEKVWNAWTRPEHIKEWNAASDDWHTTAAEVDLKVGGKFMLRMEAKDGSTGFDFRGTYEKIIEEEAIEYSLEDGRRVSITFVAHGDGVRVRETFDAEEDHSPEAQKRGWQSILDRFKKYVETGA